MVVRCPRCRATIATAGPQPPPYIDCGHCGTRAYEDPNAEDFEDVAIAPAPELLFLPEELRRMSLSDQEILLPPEFAVLALGHLVAHNALITGCECLIGTPERLRSLIEYPGLRVFLNEPHLPRKLRITLAAGRCRRIIQEHATRFATSKRTDHLYFSLQVDRAQ